jgi:Tfp pilus assembly protein PilN
MSQVNLLPPEILQGQKTKRTALVVLAAGGVLLALLLGFYLLQTQRLADVEEQITAQEQTNAQIQSEIDELQRFEDLQIEAQQKEQLLANAYAGEIAFSGLLMDVSRIVPSDAFLQSLAVTAEPSQPGEGEEDTGATFVGNLAFGGEALGVDSVSQFLTRIEQVDGWVNPWASSIAQVEAAIDSWSYAITVDLTEAVLTPRGAGSEEPSDG